MSIHSHVSTCNSFSIKVSTENSDWLLLHNDLDIVNRLAVIGVLCCYWISTERQLTTMDKELLSKHFAPKVHQIRIWTHPQQQLYSFVCESPKVCRLVNARDQLLWNYLIGFPPIPHPLSFNIKFLIGCPPLYRDPVDALVHVPLIGLATLAAFYWNHLPDMLLTWSVAHHFEITISQESLLQNNDSFTHKSAKKSPSLHNAGRISV